MDFYGINILDKNVLNFKYDKYYKEVALKLKNIKDIAELNKERIELRNKFSERIDIKIENIEILKDNFIKILEDENSAIYLWLLYSKYENNENYIDKISNILKRENQVVRGGVNLYKLNGWMTHSLYVYQLANYNVAQNKTIINFNEEARAKEYVNELYKVYESLTQTSKFILKILTLIHDIGVIEDVTYHDKTGCKYVDKVLKEIGITDKILKNFNISYKDFRIILEEIIKYHTIMSLLSGENSDKCVEDYFSNILENIPEILVKKEIPKIIYIFTFADIIAVNEKIMDEEKFQRLKNAYIFFEESSKKQKHNRNKEKVSLERICDICGKSYFEVSEKIDGILISLKIDKSQFIEDMYDVKWLHYTAPLMKTLNNLEVAIQVIYEVMNLIKEIDGKNALSEYIITFVPNRPSIEYEFIEMIKNGDFFKAINVFKEEKKNSNIYKKMCIEKKENEYGKHLDISVLE